MASPYGQYYDTNIQNAQNAYNAALSRANADRRSTLNDYGFSDPSGTDYSAISQQLLDSNGQYNFASSPLQVGSGNPYGKFQQMIGGQGKSLTALSDSAYARGLSGSGIEGQSDSDARFQFGGDRSNLLSGLDSGLTNINRGVLDQAMQFLGYRNDQLHQKTMDEDQWLADHPLADPPATTPIAGDPVQNAVNAGNNSDWEAMIRLANQRGDTAGLAKLFKDKNIPEHLRKMADQYYNAWVQRRKQSTTFAGKETAAAAKAPPKNVKPDKAPTKKR